LPLRAALAAVAIAAAVALRTAPVKQDASGAEVKELHERLEKIAVGLEGMLGQKDGALAKTHVAPELQAFTKQLQQTLKETADAKDPKAALKRLQDAEAGVASLTKDLTGQQESIMKEQEAQKESLLLGVLMTHQKDPMAAQLKILGSDDFATLEVSKTLLAKHDEKMPLFKQAADFLDQHGHKVQPADVADKKEKLAALASNLQKRVDVLQRECDEGDARHKKAMEEIEAQEKKASKKDKHTLEMIKKRQERKYKKFAAVQHRDLDSMKSAVVALKNGDVKALEKVQEALKKSMQAMQSQNGGFLHLLQLGHRVMRRDCPFCAAQCVDKCHTEGKSYAQCLTVCADAGKGF